MHCPPHPLLPVHPNLRGHAEPDLHHRHHLHHPLAHVQETPEARRTTHSLQEVGQEILKGVFTYS